LSVGFGVIQGILDRKVFGGSSQEISVSSDEDKKR